ncbi:hypothetical protein PYCCODRAFT_1430316 [Trametes coccinea BRFM310]|uniref:RNA-dependent RNA polymerase n=1 Tax=Trametes coccinea (strain BRFM310) TaxID=1353009 RepID=A0A1Y2J469_TRAC3|nr:hypothetical protein PYCCODRAFT_1430316 [Trametes coccinea BRFM310]
MESGFDLPDQSQIPSRSASMQSLSSQSTSYTEMFEEDISTYFHQIDDDSTPSSNTPIDVEEVSPVLCVKRKRDAVDSIESETPPRYRLRDRSAGPSWRRAKPDGSFVSTSPANIPQVRTPQSSSNTSRSPTVLPGLPPIAAWQRPQAVVVGQAPLPFQRTITRWPWGARWELARLINTGFDAAVLSHADVTEPRLLGKNAEAAPHVKRLVEEKLAIRAREGEESLQQFAAAFQREQAVKLPWDELDREEAILCVQPLGGLGCNSQEHFLEKDPDWYAGRIHFTAQLHKEKGGMFRLLLDRPVLGTSNRFARRFGSRRFIRVRLHKDVMWNTPGDELREYFKQPFVVAGAVFRAFYAKEQNVFLFRTNENVQQEASGMVTICPPSSLGSPESGARQKEYSLMDFLAWHNNLEFNRDQTMVKWAARFALGLSNSVPGVRLMPRDVRFMPDIICDAFKGPGKPPSEMQMTDGCGIANRALMRALKAKFPTWPEEPTAVQFRLAGGKGLALVRHDLPPEEEEHPTLWLRPSQIKIKYTARPVEERLLLDDADPAWSTLDVVRSSRMNTPVRLSVETITNLAENGVPHAAFQELFTLDLEERIGPLLDFTIPEQPRDMQALWHAIARTGSVMLSRVAREAVGIARAAGYVMEDDLDDLDDEDEDGLNSLDKALNDSSSAWWEDPISGLPSRLDETALTLLDSGFIPSKCPVLKAKLREFIKQTITTFRTKYRFAVPMSCAAFIVPDPFGVLGPNEIHVKCSRRDFVDPAGRKTDLVIGDVLVTRHPCKVPSDVQKVKAVFHEKLRHYYDVIVVSTKSHTYKGKPLDRHLASLTGGGDYDGDTMQVFWDPRIVDSFKEPDPTLFATEPPAVQQCLVKDATLVSTFLAAIPPSAPEEYKICALQHYLLGALRGSAHVSLYSSWWEKSTYKQGYDHPETIFLAYMFCAVLDGLKTGVSVDPEAFARHRDKWSTGALLWKSEKSDDNRILKRPSGSSTESLPPFIMDELQKHVKAACNQLLARMEQKLGHPRQDEGACRSCREDHVGCKRCDADLVQPWLSAIARARQLDAAGQSGMWAELQQIKRHVQEMHENTKDFSSSRSGSGSGSGSGPSSAGHTAKNRNKAWFTALPIEKRQDILREQSKKFHASPEGLLYIQDPTVVKASYAYFYDHQVKGWSRFPWNVAARALCEIKAKALGPSKTITGDFYLSMAVSPVYVKPYLTAKAERS